MIAKQAIGAEHIENFKFDKFPFDQEKKEIAFF